jgi:hypothetical protein
MCIGREEVRQGGGRGGESSSRAATEQRRHEEKTEGRKEMGDWGVGDGLRAAGGQPPRERRGRVGRGVRSGPEPPGRRSRHGKKEAAQGKGLQSGVEQFQHKREERGEEGHWRGR